MKTEIKVKLAEGVEMPQFKTDNSSSFDLKVNSFKKLYKGKKEMDLNKINTKSIEEGYLTLRPFERLVVGTGVSVDLPTGMVVQIGPKPKYVLHPGIIAISAIVGTIQKGEILVTLYNPSQFLTKVYLGDIAAIGIIVRIEQASFLPE